MVTYILDCELKKVKKYLLYGIGLFVICIICIAVVRADNVLKSNLTSRNSDQSVKRTRSEDKKPPEVKYRSFSTQWASKDTDRIIDQVYIFKNELLPKKLELANKILTIQDLNILRSPTSFDVRAKIIYDGKEETIIIKDWGEGENRYFTALIVLSIKEWHENPTEEEKARDIRNIYYEKRIYIQEVDCNLSSGDWNYIKIVLALYKEEQPVIYIKPPGWNNKIPETSLNDRYETIKEENF